MLNNFNNPTALEKKMKTWKEIWKVTKRTIFD